MGCSAQHMEVAGSFVHRGEEGIVDPCLHLMLCTTEWTGMEGTGPTLWLPNRKSLVILGAITAHGVFAPQAGLDMFN